MIIQDKKNNGALKMLSTDYRSRLNGFCRHNPLQPFKKSADSAVIKSLISNLYFILANHDAMITSAGLERGE